MKRKELLPYLDAALSLLWAATPSFVNKNGYLYITRKDYPELFAALDTLKYFDFQRTNKTKQIVGIHQASCYLYRGVWAWRYYSYKIDEAYANGTIRSEVHHLDSDVTNNCKDNLVYVTPQQNSLCADSVSKQYHGLRALNSACVKKWNVCNSGLADTAKLIRLTMIRTLEAMSFTIEQMPTVANILLQLPYNVGKEVIKQWRFSWNAEVESKMQSLNGSAA